MKRITAFFVGLFLTFFTSGLMAQDVQVTVTGIKTGKGSILLNVFKDNNTYDQEKPYKKLQFDKKALANGTLTVKFLLEPGVYGITLLDDENDNGIIDKTMLRMPKEGFGFSNFYMEKLKKPSFDDFKVTIKPGVNKIDIRVKYM